MKFINNLSINKKLILFFLLIGIGSIVIVGLYSFYSAKKALFDRTFDQLISIRVVKKDRIEGFLNDRKKDIKLFSQSEEVKKMVFCQTPQISRASFKVVIRMKD